MATAKKSTVKKAKATTSKSTAVKRAPAKSSASVTKVKKLSHQVPSMRSFRLSRQDEPFFTFRITHQTVYWLILAAIVLCLGMWVIDINVKVQKIYDQIDQTNLQTFNMTMPTTKKQ